MFELHLAACGRLCCIQRRRFQERVASGIVVERIEGGEGDCDDRMYLDNTFVLHIRYDTYELTAEALPDSKKSLQYKEVS